MSGERVLAVDDEPRYREVIRFNLETAGYRVETAESGEEALELLAAGEPDLVVLDVMLPGIDGLEVLRRVRDHSSCPVIMLTAKGEEDDKVRGLRLGADDYVTKPFSAQELLARVEAVLRRARGNEPAESQPQTIAIGDLQIDLPSKRVTLAGQEVRLSPTEYRLLLCLAENAGVLLDRDELLTRVWGPAYKGEDEILRVSLWRLRQKLADDPSQPRYIVTRPGLGYMFALPDAS
ncbi:MAG TPA: response regulator transcription factor [Gaiellaceae bacterium]|nr:response regulator transcription factor [Gaiellaceae bacterium]